jgi:hypothetical protein
MRRIVFSLFSSFDGDCQSGSFVIQRNRDKRSTRKFDVGVFTQPGPGAEVALFARSYRLVVATVGVAWLSPISATTTPTT